MADEPGLTMAFRFTAKGAGARLGRWRAMHWLTCQRPIDRSATDLERLRDGRRSHAFGFELLDLGRIDARLTSPVDAPHLSTGDAFQLPLLPQIGLELREYAEHVEEAFACGCAGVDWLLSRLERRITGLH